MNSNNYRLVFSRIRRMLVAVGETATAAGKEPGQTSCGGTPSVSSAPSGQVLRVRQIAFAALVLLGVIPAWSNAQMVPGGANAPSVIQTQNGLDQVNINRPSGAGVSMNTYGQFDVPQRGAILNNSPTIVQTQQAGLINGNPNFGPGQAARVIVNQVNGGAASQINGHLEVAGQRAEVVIANGSGISVNGGGFINTSRAILTTGTPNFAPDGSLSGFNVRGGDIAVQGAGLNASNVNQVDLIARAVKANAAIFAKNLNVVTGANAVDHDTLATTRIAGEGDGPVTGVSIDLGDLGSMYAGRIFLVGTENGVGVSTKGILAVDAGDLILQADGKLVLAGQTSASGDIRASARDGIDNSGTTFAQQSVNLSTSGVLANTGVVAAQQNTTVSAGSVASTGTLGAGVNSDGTTAGTGDLSVNATGTVSNVGGTLSGSAVTVAASSIDNTNGEISGDTLSLSATGDLVNRGGRLTQYGTADESIHAGGTIDNKDGTIVSNAGNLRIAAGSIANDDGAVEHAGAGELTVSASGALSNASGAIQTNGALAVSGTNVNNTSGTLIAQKSAQVIGSTGIVNRGGTIYGGEALALSTQRNIDNTSGSAQTGGNLDLGAGGALVNTQGTVSANGAHSALNVTAGDIDNTSGKLANAGDGLTNVTASNVTNTGGTLGGNGDVTVNAQTLVNDAGANLVAGSAANLNVTQTVNNTDGTLFSGTTLKLNQAAVNVINAGGTILGGLDVSLTVGALSNAGGSIRANRDVSASGAMSGDGDMIAGHDLVLAATGDYTNGAANNLRADHDMTVSASGTLANTGTLAAGGALTASGANVINAASGVLNSSATTVNAAGTLVNDGRIEGDAVRTHSTALANTGTIIGNDVQLFATDMTNSGESAVIAGAQFVGLYASNSVTNADGALIYSMGDLEIARNNTRDAAGLLASQTDTLTNRAADISADGNIDIAAHTLTNVRTGVLTQAGAPQTTATQTLTLWTAGIPIGDLLRTHSSSTFAQWNWTPDKAPLKGEMIDRLKAPVSVTVPRSQVSSLDTAAQTFSLTQPLIEVYSDASKTTAFCNDHGCQQRPVPQARDIATNPVQWYNSITDNGDSYTITFWPDFDPQKHIRPDQARVDETLGDDKHDYVETSRTVTTTTATDTLISAGRAATIQAQGAIRVNADGGSVSNESSTMAAGGNLVRRANGGSVSDTGTVLRQTVTGEQTSTFYWHQKTGDDSDTKTVETAIAGSGATVDALPAIASSNATVQTDAATITIASVDRNGQTVTGSGVTGGSADGTVTGQPVVPLQTLGGATGGIPNLKLPAGGLYTYHPAPDTTYLVATDPRFTQYANFISSDYMLGQLGIDPMKTIKRLGDGMVEQMLIRNQITQLTGRTFLAGYTDNMAEYTALMTNGVAYAKEFELTPGIALSAAQMQQLTTDMVWLVSQDVTLPDGSHQTVLVPQVYL
ncbi:two-partner secretion domain-containing protein, partial [Paraburkholderia jirisanensis]